MTLDCPQDEPNTMRVLIENEAGSTIKTPTTKSRWLSSSASRCRQHIRYPYGFAIGTRSGDGDAVDCFVLTERPLSAGSVVECNPVALLEQIEDGEIDHKVLAALPGALPQLDETVLAKLKSFAAGVFAHVPGKRMTTGRLLDREAAEAYLAQW